ncbi:MAG: tetratricopeptide repeat protein [Verrucomicrobiales bacterium]
MSRTAVIASALLLVLVVVIAYTPAIRADFVWDDNEHVVADELLAADDGLFRIWLKPDHSVWNYWPLSRSTFWIERRIWGVNATVSHSINILLHAAAAVILFLGARRFALPSPWLIGGLFALHPIFVESTAWVTERTNALSAIFYLLSIWCYLAFEGNRRWRCYGLSLFLFLLALLGKSSTIMLPVILIIAKLAQRRPFEKRDLVQLAPFFLLSLLAAGGAIWFEEHVIGSSGPLFSRSLAEKFVVAGRIPFFYLLKILFPHPMIFMYPRWEMNGRIPLEFLPAIALVAISVFLLRHYSTWGRLPLLALGAFLVTLFPVLGFFDVYGMRYTFVADHWAYLPALPILVFLGGSLGTALKDHKFLRRLSGGTILVICGVLSWQHAHAFKSLEILWRDTLAKNPSCWLAHNNLGSKLYLQEDTTEAIAHYQESLRLNPNYEVAHYNLGVALADQGRFPEAIQHYSAALLVAPNYVLAHFNLANALLAHAELDQAIAHYEATLQIDPSYATAHNNLGIIQLQKGDRSPAIRHFRKALQINPDYIDALNNLRVTLQNPERVYIKPSR